LKKKKKIFEGKSKKLYETDDPEEIILEFKDEIVTRKGEIKGVLKGKGIINNQISEYLLEYLSGFHIATHFVKKISNRDMLIKQLEMIPVEIVVRNIAAGEFCNRYGLVKGKELDFPIIEYFLKGNKNPMINTTHILSFGYAKLDEIRTIERLSSKINAVLKSFFMRRQFKLIDFKLEFGRFKNKLLIGDEISLDTCRLLDEKFWDGNQKSIIFSDEGDLDKVYEEIKNRIFQNE